MTVACRGTFRTSIRQNEQNPIVSKEPLAVFTLYNCTVDISMLRRRRTSESRHLRAIVHESGHVAIDDTQESVIVDTLHQDGRSRAGVIPSRGVGRSVAGARAW